MRIRVFQAFASNNSGSYTIVGSFESIERAEEVAAELRALCVEHTAWHVDHEWDYETESPFDRFARAHGLTQAKPGRSEEWPDRDEPPSVLAVGMQVLVYVPFTATMPRAIGEFFYKREGRVQVEINHAHHPLAVECQLWFPSNSRDRSEVKAKPAAVIDDLRSVLPPLLARHEGRVVMEPVFDTLDWGGRRVVAVFDDIIAGVEAVRAAAAAHGVSLQVSVRELDAHPA